MTSTLPRALRACIDRYEEAVKEAAFAGTFNTDVAEFVRAEALRRRKLLEAAIERNIERATK